MNNTMSTLYGAIDDLVYIILIKHIIEDVIKQVTSVFGPPYRAVTKRKYIMM